jgi:hypothetical protein
MSHKFIYHFRGLSIAMFEHWCPIGLLFQRPHTLRNSVPKALPLCTHKRKVEMACILSHLSLLLICFLDLGFCDCIPIRWKLYSVG